MKNFSIPVSLSWFDSNDHIIDQKIKNYSIKSSSIEDARIKAEQKASNDSNFNWGKPDEVYILE